MRALKRAVLAFVLRSTTWATACSRAITADASCGMLQFDETRALAAACAPSSVSNSGIPSPVLRGDADGAGETFQISLSSRPVLESVDLIEAPSESVCPTAPISSSTALTARICSSACGWLTSTTCSSSSACTTSSRVALNASTRRWGSLRMKPTVSVSSTFWLRGQAQTARRGIERGEHLVFGQRGRAGQGIEQRRFAGVGVTHDGRQRPEIALAARRAGSGDAGGLPPVRG